MDGLSPYKSSVDDLSLSLSEDEPHTKPVDALEEMIQAKRSREEETKRMRAEVAAWVGWKMDTGVVVNKELASYYANKKPKTSVTCSPSSSEPSDSELELSDDDDEPA